MRRLAVVFGVGALILNHEGFRLRIQMFDHHPLIFIVLMHALGVPLGPTEAEKLLPSSIGEFGHLALAAGPENFELTRTLLPQVETAMDKVRWHRRQWLPALCLTYDFLMQTREQLGTLHLTHLEAPHLIFLPRLIRFDRVSLGRFILRQ